MEQHLRLEHYEQEWTCALAVGLINKAWFRVGSRPAWRRSRTYGITTLTKRHVSVDGDEVRFRFRTKNRKLVRRTIPNATLAHGVAALLELPGRQAPVSLRARRRAVELTGPLLNGYLGEHLGNGFTAKDFRTWGGTLSPRRSSRAAGCSGRRETTRAVAAVMRKVGDELGNTAAVARDSYVSPAVIDAYLAGRTLEDFRGENGRRPRGNLTVDERALVRLLRTTSK